MNGFEQQPPQRGRGCLRDAAIVACVLAALILVVGAAAYFAFVVADHTLQQENLASLTEAEVRADLQGLRLSDPDLSSYAYVSNETLDGPRFDDIEIGAIRYGSMKDGRMTPTTRAVTAKAVWENSYVSVERPVSAEFEFVSAEDGWKLSIYTLSDMEVTPLRPPNIYDLESDVVPLLRLYDATLGDAFADAHVALSADLDERGGTAKAVLTKETESGPAECTVDLDVSWSDQHGWMVEVAGVDGPSGEVAATEEPQPIAAVPVTQGYEGGAVQRLFCHAGDLVSLSGTLTQRDGIFVLETVPTEVTMSGRSWVLERFVLTGPSGRLTESLGGEVAVEGYLTAGYVFEDAPLSLAVRALS